ncbi:alanine dehydrogenase [Aurantivibrio plasticivorans]
MRIGIPKEIKSHEYRVGLTPDNVRQLCECGHKVLVQQNAGAAIGFNDEMYHRAGAEIFLTAEGVYRGAELIVKVKEPQPEEIPFINDQHLVFGYLHLAACKSLTTDLMATGASCVAYETIVGENGGFPLLAPMSQVAGRYAVQAASQYLANPYGGTGILLGGVTGVPAAEVLIIGAGMVGTEAAKIALGLGGRVTLIDRSIDALRKAENVFGSQVITQVSSESALLHHAKKSQVIVGAVLVSGAKAPHVLTRENLKFLQQGTVLVDVAIDQGGCFESSRPTTHDEPTFLEDGIIHYCVANIPGAVARTSTLALSNATLPYVMRLADKGKSALKERMFLGGENITGGHLVNEAVAKAHDLHLFTS